MFYVLYLGRVCASLIQCFCLNSRDGFEPKFSEFEPDQALKKWLESSSSFSMFWGKSFELQKFKFEPKFSRNW